MAEIQQWATTITGLSIGAIMNMGLTLFLISENFGVIFSLLIAGTVASGATSSFFIKAVIKEANQ